MMHHAVSTEVVEQAGRTCEDIRGFFPASADRCTYISYADMKKKKTKQVVHASGDNEATQSSSRQDIFLMRRTTMRSMRISCSNSWRQMSTISSGYGLLT